MNLIPAFDRRGYFDIVIPLGGSLRKGCIASDDGDRRVVYMEGAAGNLMGLKLAECCGLPTVSAGVIGSGRDAMLACGWIGGKGEALFTMAGLMGLGMINPGGDGHWLDTLSAMHSLQRIWARVDIMAPFWRMTICDMIAGNRKRHPSRFGFVADISGIEPRFVRMAPMFACEGSFEDILAGERAGDIVVPNGGTLKSFLEFESPKKAAAEIAAAYDRERFRQALEEMIGFDLISAGVRKTVLEAVDIRLGMLAG